MSAMYQNLQKAHFGSKSEKQKPQAALPADCEQRSIFNEAEAAADAKTKDPTALPESTVEVKSHKRAKKRSREELLDELPVEIHEYELPAEEQVCRRCGHALEKIGREYIRKECEYIPAQVGADDYIAKPFRPRELISRIKSALRRSGGSINTVQLDNVTVDTEKAVVMKNGQEIALSALEYKLLLVFAANRGRMLSRTRLLEEIWDAAGEYVNDNTLTVYIKRIREKIEDDPANPTIIKTVRGMGYRVD